jgi:hypothetical protein
MKCDEVRTRLSDYVGGDLFPSEQEAVASHLAQCATCRAEAAVLQRCERALGVLGVVAETPDLSEDLRRRIAAPLPWRRRWGAAAVVAGVALAVTAMGALLWPRERVPDVTPSPPVVVEAPGAAEGGPAIVGQVEVMSPRVTVAAPELPAAEMAETPQAPMEREVAAAPVEVVAEPVADNTTNGEVSPAEFGEEAVFEMEPAMTLPASASDQAGGVVLLLGEPEPVRPTSSCYLEVSLPNGARSVLERSAEVGAAGAPRVIQISYEHIAPQPKAQD